MPNEKYKVELTEEEVKTLNEITHKGNTSSAKTIMHANVLLQTNDVNPNKKADRDIAEMFSISKTTVNQIRKTYATEGLKSALCRKTRLTAPILSKITGEFEALVIAAALSPAPQERARWTLRLLAEHCVEKQYIVSISYVAIGGMLNQVKPHISEYWCIPKENDASFVASMEDVLNIYQRPYNPLLPVICMDEKPIQFLDEARQRIQAKPLRIDPDTDIAKGGRTEKIDSEYVRCGHGSIFIVTNL
jgi:transposase